MSGLKPQVSIGGGNKLLAALSPGLLSLLRPHLQQREIQTGTVLWNAANPDGTVYFPHSSLMSISIEGPNGNCIECASVGREGAVGAHETFGGGPTTRATAIMGGATSTISARRFFELQDQTGELATLAYFSKHWILVQSQHMAACNALHSAEERLCRWLLLSADRLGGDIIYASQEQIADLLGVRRTTVTLVAHRLQNANFISYARAKITIRNREALQAAACSCYSALSKDNWPSKRLTRAARIFPVPGTSSPRSPTEWSERREIAGPRDFARQPMPPAAVVGRSAIEDNRRAGRRS
jgi:CRP-like cAMP-binding protein